MRSLPRSTCRHLRVRLEHRRAYCSPCGVLIFALYCAAWILFGNGLEWHSLATLATWGMTLVIQRAEHRDTQAIHAKLDELLKATNRANNDIMRIDGKDAEEVEREREKVRTERAKLHVCDPANAPRKRPTPQLAPANSSQRTRRSASTPCPVARTL